MNRGRREGYRALVIEARGLTKDYGDKRAVDDLTFSVEPGVVTGFLGPNGSGKSTTMRLILGLYASTVGDVTVNGKHYREHQAPLHEVGALLEARSVHTERSAYQPSRTTGPRRARTTGRTSTRSTSASSASRSPSSRSACSACS
jgi:ABC-2 type transport system ATP-binding protein